MASLLIGVMIWTMLFMPCESSFPTYYANNKPALAQPNYGVIFRPVQKHFVATDSIHQLYFQLKFPKLTKLPDLPIMTQQNCDKLKDNRLKPSTYFYNSYREHINQTHYEWHVTHRMDQQAIAAKRTICNQTVKFLKEFNDRYVAYKAEIEHSYSTLQEMLKSKTEIPKECRKKAILGFLAPLFGSVFGLASNNQIKQIQNNMETVLYNQDLLANETQNIKSKLITFANAKSQRIDNLWTAVTEINTNAQRTQKTLQQLTTRTARYLNMMDNDIADLYRWVQQLTEMHDNTNLLLIDCALIKQKLDIWHASINGLASGLLPEQLISQSDVSAALKSVEQKLIDHYPAFKLIHGSSDIQYYFLHDVATSFVRENNDELEVIIHVGLLLSTMNNKYDIYQMDVHPVPLMSNESEHTNGYTILDSETTPDFFVLTSNNQFFTELSTAQYLFCESLQDTTCPLLATIYASQKGSCAGALYFNRNDEVARLCTFIIHPNTPVHDQITYISDSTYLVSAPNNQYTIECPGMAQQQYHGHYDLVKVPCACAVHTKQLRLPLSLAACTDKTHEVTVSFPKNAVQIQLFQIDDPNLNEPETKPPYFEIPEEFGSVNLQKFQQIDDKFKVDMHQAALISGGNTIKLRKLHPVVINSSIMNWNTILVYLAMGVSVANLILLAILAVRHHMQLKTVWPVLAVLKQQIQNEQASAARIMTKDTVTEEGIDYTGDNILVYCTCICIIVSLITIVYLGAKLLKKLEQIRANRKYNYHTDLFFNLSDLHNSVEVKVASFPTCIANVSIELLPDIKNIEVKMRQCQKPMIQILWFEPFKVKCDDVRFTFAGAQESKTVTRRIAELLQQALYAPTTVRDKLYSRYRLQCNCTCRGARQIIHHFAPEKFNLQTRMDDRESQELRPLRMKS